MAGKVAKSSRPFTEGKFLKKCMIKVCDVLPPDKRPMLVNVNLSGNTIADRVCKMSANLRAQLSKRSIDFIAYSLAVDESTDMTDPAHLAIFIRGMDSNLRVTEEIVDIKSLHGTTTGNEIFENVSSCNRHETTFE